MRPDNIADAVLKQAKGSRAFKSSGSEKELKMMLNVLYFSGGLYKNNKKIIVIM